MKTLCIQVVRKNESKGLKYVQKHIDLGWRYASKKDLGSEVYFVTLVWEQDNEPIYPPESQLGK